MEYKEIIDKIKPEMDKAINFLEGELMNIRIGRASPCLIENIVIDCFGQKFQLKQLGAISLSGPRQLIVQPWDKSYIESIEKALGKSSLGINSVVDKDIIRINFPPLTEEFRKKLLRLLSEKYEEARKTIRRWREEAWREIQEGFREGKIREDDKFRAKDELQELINVYNKKIENLSEEKKREIME